MARMFGELKLEEAMYEHVIDIYRRCVLHYMICRQHLSWFIAQALACCWLLLFATGIVAVCAGHTPHQAANPVQHVAAIQALVRRHVCMERDR